MRSTDLVGYVAGRHDRPRFGRSREPRAVRGWTRHRVAAPTAVGSVAGASTSEGSRCWLVRMHGPRIAVVGHMERHIVLLKLDLDTLDNLLAIMADAIAHRGDQDLAGVVRLVQRQVEQIAEHAEKLEPGQ